MAGTRLHVVGSFVFFALVVAPFAWHLTQVQRVDLPSTRIKQLSWTASPFAQPETHHVNLYVADAKHKHQMPSSSTRVVYEMHVLTRLSEDERKRIAGLADLHQADEELLKVVGQSSTTASFQVILLCQPSVSVPWRFVVGKYRHAWSLACSPQDSGVQDALARLILEHVLLVDQSVAKETNADTSKARVALKYRVQFTLLKENPSTTPWEREFQALVRTYMGPLIEKMQVLANFTEESQVVHYAKLGKDITPSPNGDFYTVHIDELKQFKSRNDYLAASVLADREQQLHFMAALPDASHAPLRIRGVDDHALASSFEIPGWGAVVALDTHQFAMQADKNGHLLPARPNEQQRELKRMLGLFVSQFRKMFGVPSFHKRQQCENELGSGLLFLPATRDGIASWELDAVARTLFKRHTRTTVETLQSIVQLVEDWSQMSVLERVQQRVVSSVALMEEIQSTPPPESGRALTADSLLPLLAKARAAAHDADAAYYDHTMIRQLYFPQEQMFGVYAPLLAPLILPFFLGFVREYKRYKAKVAKKREAANDGSKAKQE